MPTTRTYVLKLLLGIFLVTIFLVVTPIILGLIVLALPPSLAVYAAPFFMRPSEEFVTHFFYALLGVLLLTATLLFYRMLNRATPAENPAHIVWYRAFSLLATIFMAYGFSIIIATAFGPSYGNCEAVGEKLKGGVHEFFGKKYRIQLCGTDPDDSHYVNVRLRVFNEDNRLLASRYFKANWDFQYPHGLEYENDRIRYFDVDDQDYEKTLVMPPSWGDRVRTAIPLLR